MLKFNLNKSSKFIVLINLFFIVGIEVSALTNDPSTTDSQWKMCPPPARIAKKPEYSNRKTNRNNYEIRAETTMINQEGVSQFSGEVEVIQGERAIAAELIKYDKNQNFSAEGPHVWDANVYGLVNERRMILRKKYQRLKTKFLVSQWMGRGASSKLR